MQRVLDSGCSLCELTKEKDAKGHQGKSFNAKESQLGTCHDN